MEKIKLWPKKTFSWRRRLYNIGNKLIGLILVYHFSICPYLFSRQIQHEVRVINIEVPVRVFNGQKFVHNLSLDDFELFEDGQPQKIEAVYLIQKTNILKKDEKKISFSPKLWRHFVLVFELNEYLPEIGDTVDYLFEQLILPGDTLQVLTPVNAYNLKDEALKRLSRKEIASQLKDKLKHDLELANSEYRNLSKNLADILVAEIDDDLKEQLYLETVRKLKDFKTINPEKLLALANHLKNFEGQKFIFLFYQRETIPLLQKISNFSLPELKREINFDVNTLKQAFSDSSISVHFIYITKNKMIFDLFDVDKTQPLRVELFDQSHHIFRAFIELAKTTGGLAESSANAAVSFQKAVEASENYYLIYYAPKNYKPDGKYREIKVKVKGKNYQVIHRAGYFAQ